MNSQESINFARVADAIEYIRLNFKKQPSLDEIAKEVGLSPAHFQKLFTGWAGVSPKKFLQYTNIEYAKKMLDEGRHTIFDVAYETGLSGTGRLYDLFVKIEGMTPGEYKNEGESLSINYDFAESPFGGIILASTLKGLCYMAFSEDEEEGFNLLRVKFPKATYHRASDVIQKNAMTVFAKDWSKAEEIRLHLKGTDFQLKIWEALLKIPEGKFTTYGDIAKYIGSPKASRAVGTAVGNNPVSVIVPCHRVIRASGELGGYHWGLDKKVAIIGWEATRRESLSECKD